MEGKFRIRVAAIDPSGNSAYDDSDSDFNVVPKGAENKPLKVRGPSPRYMVQLFGWVYDEDPNSIQQYYNNIEKFTWVSPTWYKVGREGNIIKIGGDTEKFLKDSRRSGVKVIPMIGVNVDDRDVYRRIFEDSLFRKKFIEDLKNIFSKYDGINIDFEGIDPKYRDKFVQFMRELYNAFHREGKIVSVDVQPKTCCSRCFWCWLDWDNFPYDYRELSKYTDLFIVMAYDQHYEKSDPGPVSDLTWFEDVVNYALSKVPREKLVIGIPFYGYCWPSPKNGFGVGFQDAMNYARECNATVKFDEKVGEATFSCPSTGICWFNTAESTKLRLRKLAEKGLSKVAAWRIGQEDPETWGLISKIYKQ
jgi:spore germination protein YaaH